MSCPNRHVCLSDLNAYLKRDDYLGGYNEQELVWIRENLNILSKEDVLKAFRERTSFSLTYQEALELIANESLSPGHIYVITDYQTIYNGGESTELPLVLTAINSTEFSPIAIFLDNPQWIVLYDVVPKIINDTTQTKGTIYYMQDENNNSARYDFKNTKFGEYYTFNKNAQNVKINGLNNIFKGNVYNTEIFGNNNTFEGDVINITGMLDNYTCNHDISNGQFVKMNNKLYLTYLDSETLTMQIDEL